MVATALECLEDSTAEYVIFEKTNINTPLGLIVIAEITKEGEVTEDETVDRYLNPNEFGGNLPVNNNNPQDYGSDDPDGKNDGMDESEIKEKFQSKSQQGLFWARCNKCSDKKCKWCKMAKEFSDTTSKKQYKTMPEKKHPEKTVKKKKYVRKLPLIRQN